MKTATKLTSHPDDIAARKALAKKPKPSLASVIRQAQASEQWRKQNGFAKTASRSAARK